MIEQWLATSWREAGLVVVSSVVIFIAVVAITRLNGLRTFSKMSSFDFSVTVATGSILATVAATSSSLTNGIIALATIIGAQRLVARLRRSDSLEQIVDNTPILLMDGARVLEANLAKARVTKADLRAKLREANALDLDSVRAVVLETTGDISVLHGDHLDPSLLEGVIGVERLEPPN